MKNRVSVKQEKPKRKHNAAWEVDSSMRTFSETEKIEKESLGSYNLALRTPWWDKMETECLENIYVDICNCKQSQRLILIA